MAGERLISSTRITFPKIGPFLNSKLASFGLKTDVPKTSDGSIDEGVLQERARAGVREEQEYLKEAAGGRRSGSGESGSKAGSLLGLSESSVGGGSDEGGEDDLAKVFESMGVPEGAAKVAAAGRV